MGPIYSNNKGCSYYRMLKPAGHCSMSGYEHYALWQPVKRIKFLWTFLYFACGQRFYLDIYGFRKVKK